MGGCEPPISPSISSIPVLPKPSPIAASPSIRSGHLSLVLAASVCRGIIVFHRVWHGLGGGERLAVVLYLPRTPSISSFQGPPPTVGRRIVIVSIPHLIRMSPFVVGDVVRRMWMR